MTFHIPSREEFFKKIIGLELVFKNDLKSKLLDRNPTDFGTVLRNSELQIFRLQNKGTPHIKLCDGNIVIFSGASVKRG